MTIHIKKRFILGICLLANVAFAQKQGNFWYFGRGAGIDFNTGVAMAKTDGKINTREGCATLSDANTGELLFYTDGVRVLNRDHQVMPNSFGLTGNYSSTQSAIIVPDPGAPGKKYYLFTAGILGGLGLRYSEVDMTLDGGRGDILPGTKNTMLLSNNSEKLIATRHENGTDYWIITHEAKTDSFYVYQVSSTGISAPATYKAGSILNQTSDETGYLKVSPDGKLLANAINGPLQRVELFDFNNSTGSISGTKLVLKTLSAAYGLEFSPDSHLLYVSEQLRSAFPFSGKSAVSQFNLLAGDQLAINFSKKILTSSTSLSYGALQMAPDEKIYVAKENGFDVGVDALGVIDKPGELVPGATYQENGFDLGGKQTMIGLPTFAENFSVPFTYNGVCLGENTSFSVFNTTNVKSVLWDFGDAGSSSNTATDLVTSHLFSAEGIYTVTLTITYSNNTSKVNTIKVTISSVSEMNLGRDTTLCVGQTMVLKGFNSSSLPAGLSFRWQDGSSNATYTVNQPGKYWVEVTLGSCQAKDTLVVGYLNPASVLGNDTTVCSGTILKLNINAPGATYLWQDGSGNPTFDVAIPGTYWVDIQAGGCQARDSIEVNFVPSPFFGLGRDTSLCKSGTLLLSAFNKDVPTATYQWQDNSTAATFLVDSPGTYWAEATLGDCKIRDSIVVGFVEGPPVVDLGKDTTFSQWGPGVVLNASSPYATYFWKDGSTDSTLTVREAGTYWVKVTNGCGSVSDTILVSTATCGDFQIPNVFTPNGDGQNDQFVAVCDDGRWLLEVFDRWGIAVYRDGVYKNQWEAEGLREGVYFYSLVNHLTREVRRGWVQVIRD